jgi:hypothetical protein
MRSDGLIRGKATVGQQTIFPPQVDAKRRGFRSDASAREKAKTERRNWTRMDGMDGIEAG